MHPSKSRKGNLDICPVKKGCPIFPFPAGMSLTKLVNYSRPGSVWLLIVIISAKQKEKRQREMNGVSHSGCVSVLVGGGGGWKDFKHNLVFFIFFIEYYLVHLGSTPNSPAPFQPTWSEITTSLSPLLYFCGPNVCGFILCMYVHVCVQATGTNKNTMFLQKVWERWYMQ